LRTAIKTAEAKLEDLGVQKKEILEELRRFQVISAPFTIIVQSAAWTEAY
jgi:hypothetical protein